IYRVAVTGERDIKRFREEIGFVENEFNQRLDEYISEEKSLRKNMFGTIPAIGNLVTTALEELNLPKKGTVGWSLEDYANDELNFTRRTLERILPVMEERYLDLFNSIQDLPEKGDKLRELRRKFGVDVEEIAEELDVSAGTIYYREDNSVLLDEYREVLKERLQEKLETKKTIEFLKHLVQGDVGWVQVNSVETVDEKRQWVYDVTVPGQTFISNGMVLHNTVSISKATIQATLPAQTSIIGGANPKLSRFDPYRPISEQIDIPDTLLDRFDLRFALRDVPDEERDEKLVDHIIKSRVEEDSIEPQIDHDFLKKYVAYARKNCHPEMTKKASATLKNFYINLRGKYIEGESETVPITLRQYEALQRLSQASAKVRLDDKVKKEDAQRAIKLMKYSIKQLGMDPDSDEIDIDRAEGGTPASERSKIRVVMDLLDGLEEDIGENIPEEDLIAEMEEENINNPEKVLREMKNKGMIFEPRPGHVQKI
ncbi:MAG: hypothetical protein ABEJ72_09300, partial [Candidatus Aenigmatarchaeota archaeon]